MKEDKYGAHPRTEQELVDYIHGLTEKPHDYNTSADAMWQAAIATFNYIGHALGTTGFQAGYASLEFLQRANGYNGPFGILDGSKILYPQYDLRKQANEWVDKWTLEVAPEAAERLREYDEGTDRFVSPAVVEHWRALSQLVPRKTP